MPRVWIGAVNILFEQPRRNIDDVAVVHVPGSFPRQVRNDTVGDVVHLIGLLAVRIAQFPFLHRRGKLLCGHLHSLDFLTQLLNSPFQQIEHFIVQTDRASLPLEPVLE
jgi:hypothetical protein